MKVGDELELVKYVPDITYCAADRIVDVLQHADQRSKTRLPSCRYSWLADVK